MTFQSLIYHSLPTCANVLMADVLLVQLNSMSCVGVKEEDMGMPTKAADVECRVC